VIDFGFLIYGFLLAAMLGLAVLADARRRARRRISDAAPFSTKFPH
jgi:hypothetical protein